MADRGYSVLLSHLHKPSSTLPLDTLRTLITFNLAHTPTPRPLSATIISSPLFRPFSRAKLTALLTAFRHAVHVRLTVLEDEDKTAGIFRRGVKPRMEEWVKSVVMGFSGGQGMIRLVGAGGILLGLEDLKERLGAQQGSGGARARSEDEVVVAVAEVMDVYGGPKDSAWEKEFQPETENGQVDVLHMALLFAAQFLPHVFPERLKALPLSMLCFHLMSSIETTFLLGTFLNDLASSCVTNSGGHLSLTHKQDISQTAFPYENPSSMQRSSPLAMTLRMLTSSPLFTSVATLTKLLSRSIPLLMESRPADGWHTVAQILDRLDVIAANIDEAWSQSALSSVEENGNIAPESREIATAIWTVLKTFLFTTVMISQSILSTVVYTVPPSTPSPSDPTAFSLSLATLRILSHLAFVISQFGGITTASEGGFSELKRVFYTSLDVLSASPGSTEHFVKMLASEEMSTPGSSSSSGAPDFGVYLRSKKALRLGCIEQLIPVLGISTIENSVFPLCVPHLYDPLKRELYESAHSVVLAMFAAHAQRRSNHLESDHDELSNGTSQSSSFIEKIVPFYARCLLENSGDGKLNTVQLRLAYAALTSGANTSSPTLAQFCLQALLDEISAVQTNSHATAHTHRLHLTLISSLPSLPLPLLPSALDAVADIIQQYPGDVEAKERQTELIHSVFKAILEQIGDREKEYAMRWWADHKLLFDDVEIERQDAGGDDTKGKAKAENAANARL
ncbi:hypothetical protein EVG20_g6041 [Dentipellis fragilis]|uniref:Peroxisomal membrane protein PEX17 n=1 Tax=Dentipellis fragilis TaxID=205917 RepID=A0A4Y9YRJ4_9AGAM|nr:hypothetical protein EVG20_g6041 [Dentipellis fragilis]